MILMIGKSNEVAVCWGWHFVKMAFLKRKRFKFNVDLQLVHLSDVPLVNAVLFAKVRLLDGGTFAGVTERVEVLNHSANWNRRFNFMCRIACDPETGVLERCACRISLRKEQKGGKSYQKIGFVDVNLSQFAASGVEGITQSYLLDGYGNNQRQDNSRLLIKVTMSHQSADPIFKVPRIESQLEEHLLNPVDRKAPPGDDKIPSQKQSTVDTDSTHSSSLEDLSHNYEDGCSCSLPSVASAATPQEVYQRDGASALGPVPINSGGMQSAEVMRRPAVNINLLQSRRLSQDRSQMGKGSDCGGAVTRVRATRVNAEDLIDKMLAETVIANIDDQDEHNCSRGLALFVSKDGEAVVATNSLLSTDSFERVHIADASTTLSSR
uniref:Protein FAM102A n=2 Tax=Ascaris TaxID=6251 RepID=F1L321_ASCSU